MHGGMHISQNSQIHSTAVRVVSRVVPQSSDGDAVGIFVRRETAGDSYLLLAEIGHLSRIDYHSRPLIQPAVRHTKKLGALVPLASDQQRTLFCWSEREVDA